MKFLPNAHAAKKEPKRKVEKAVSKQPDNKAQRAKDIKARQHRSI